MIYFDNAAASFPKPLQTKRAVVKALDYYGANPGRSGHDASMRCSEMVFSARNKIASLLKCGGGENIIFVQNCTQALNFAMKGVLKKGDHFLISSFEHNSVYRTAEALSRNNEISYDVVPVDIEDDEKTLREFKRRIKRNTKLICCIHGSNVFGNILPVEEICKLAHRNGILFLLDAAQTAGTLDIDVSHEFCPDYICMACHKGLFAPNSLGALVTTQESGEILTPLIYGGTGSSSFSGDMPDFLPDKLEAGTLNTTAIAGLCGGLEFIKNIGINKIHEHEMNLTNALYNELSKVKNVKLYNKPNLPVLSFNIGNLTGEETCSLLNNSGFCLRGGYHCSPLAHMSMRTDASGTARASIGPFNAMSEVSRLCETIYNISRKYA